MIRRLAALFVIVAAASVSLAQKGTLAIVGATVIDPSTGKAAENSTILIRGGRILKVGKSRSIKLPQGTRTFGAAGKFVIPGLWDMHVHAFNNFAPSRIGTNNKDSYFPLFLANGVTGIRDMASDSADRSIVRTWKAEMDRGAAGPRIMVGSEILDGDPPFFPGLSVVGNADKARAAVRQKKADGAEYIKVYWNLSPEVFDAIADESKKIGIPFVGHVPFAVSAFTASDKGQRSIEHGTGIMETCSSKEDELRKKQWTPDIEKEIKATFDMGKCRRLFRTFARNGTYSVPTLVLHRGMLLHDDKEFRSRQELAYISKTEITEWESSPQLVKDRSLEERRCDFERALEIVVAMHEEGTPLLAGTDNNNPFVVPGFDLHDELELFVRAGLSPIEALRTATWNPAAFFRMTDAFGTVSPGKIADVVILNADPRSDIRNTRSIEAVISNGNLLDRAELDKILAKAKASPRK